MTHDERLLGALREHLPDLARDLQRYLDDGAGAWWQLERWSGKIEAYGDLLAWLDEWEAYVMQENTEGELVTRRETIEFNFGTLIDLMGEEAWRSYLCDRLNIAYEQAEALEYQLVGVDSARDRLTIHLIWLEEDENADT